MQPLESILYESANRHKHLPRRQILGARIALLAGEVLGLELPRVDKRLLIIAETDGCTVDWTLIKSQVMTRQTELEIEGCRH